MKGSFQVKRAIDKKPRPEHRTPKYKALGLLVVASHSAPCWLRHVIRRQRQGSMSHQLRWACPDSSGKPAHSASRSRVWEKPHPVSHRNLYPLHSAGVSMDVGRQPGMCKSTHSVPRDRHRQRPRGGEGLPRSLWPNTMCSDNATSPAH